MYGFIGTHGNRECKIIGTNYNLNRHLHNMHTYAGGG